MSIVTETHAISSHQVKRLQRNCLVANVLHCVFQILKEGVFLLLTPHKAQDNMLLHRIRLMEIQYKDICSCHTLLENQNEDEKELPK